MAVQDELDVKKKKRNAIWVSNGKGKLVGYIFFIFILAFLRITIRLLGEYSKK